MKTIICAIGLTLVVCASSYAYDPPHASVSFGMFYSSLAPEGEWISVDAGIYAWRPRSVAGDWRPYTEGRWVWTDDGWYWASDEPWAWATYHYGRWYYDDYYGWVWIPGYDWAPAWVEWRYGGDYVGWAPLGPYALFDINLGIHYSRRWVTPYHYWSFIDCRYISSPDIHRHIFRTENNTRYIGRTRSGGSVRYEGGRVLTRGPEREYIERRGDVRVERAEIVDVGDRSQQRITGNRVDVYRPRIEDRTRDGNPERPAFVRERERSLSLDPRDLDVGLRDRAREEGRDLRKAQEYREREQTQRRLERESNARSLDRRPDPRTPPVREPAGKDNNRQQVRPDRQVQRLPEVHRVPVQRAPVVRPEGNRAERSSSPDRGFRQAAPHQDSHRDSGGARSGGRRR